MTTHANVCSKILDSSEGIEVGEGEMLRELFADVGVKGPTPAFTPVQIVYTILLLGSSEEIGRKRLKERLKIGEGSVRTLLSRLLSKGVITTTKKGIILTEKGRKLYAYLKQHLSPVLRIDFAMPWQPPHNYGVLVRGCAEKVSSGIDERDEAIRNGALAAMVLTQMMDGLYMPRVTNLSQERPDFAENVLKLFNPTVGDVIIIAGSDDENKAMYSALAAALKLLTEKA